MAKLASTQIFGDLKVDGEIKNKATTTTEGVVQLNDAVNSTSTTQGATANAVKKVNDTLATHSSNTTSHVTASERTNWNAKASTAVVTTSANGLMSKEDKTKLNGIATGANNYTHPSTSGNKHIPSGGASGQILRWSADGTAVWGADNNTTYGVVSKSANGLAPKLPNETTTTKYLRQDGTWAVPPNTTYGVASTTANGLMSSADKTKLDGVATGANKYVHPNDANTRHVTDAEKATWNGKANANHTHDSYMPISVARLPIVLSNTTATGNATIYYDASVNTFKYDYVAKSGSVTKRKTYTIPNGEVTKIDFPYATGYGGSTTVTKNPFNQVLFNLFIFPDNEFTSTTVSNVGQLPEGYRPKTNIEIVGGTDCGYPATMIINPNGQVNIKFYGRPQEIQWAFGTFMYDVG